ncbi:transketolase [Candidatus Nitrospira allomarina]|uniref:Transketolase n=1 Tax=Candidatus Nitrospira allomarina TaxID=3020900 RepID=A0AA96JRB7_9BACT|nr:transketolase [Candidatus Nitrospira allomarina]WNM56938.1 transketolase [Candidatus Nitrospira allomarina]
MNTTKATTLSPAQLEQLSINTIRFLSVDAVQKANSGHPGLPLGAAPMAYVLWTRFLQHNPSNPHWFNRDRFVLSAGHGSMLLYSLLYLTGYDLPLDQIKQFRQWGSLTPGHPERGITPGVETTTGPLGQGFGNGVGMAIAEAYLAGRYNRPGFEIIHHYTYGVVSDGDLMEGVAAETASLAGHLKLGKLIYLYDDNRVTLAASTQLTFTEDRAQRFAAYGWHTQTIDDGNDVNAIDRAIHAARQDTDRPSLILIRTHIGYGSPHKQGTFAAHGSPLGEEEVKLTKQNLGWPIDPPFHVPEEVQQHCRQAIDQGRQTEAKWHETFSEYEKEYPDLARELRSLIKGELPPGWDAHIPQFPVDSKGLATRVASGKIMDAISKALPGLIGGSADLNPSTFTELSEAGNFGNSSTAIGDLQGSAGGGWSYAGRNLQFGVREHGMGAILNGLATHGGTIPFGATFLTFSDYMRPPIRLAALMGIQVVYVFTHDSLALGEDGPTHQSVEQVASLRAIPNLIVIRPGDANETAAAWRVAIETRDRPVALILTRQSVPTLDRTEFSAADGLQRGGYILADAPNGHPDLILIASGSEVSLIVEARQKLLEQKLQVRIVSMPSWELFEAQSQEYRNTVLPGAVGARLAVEAGVSQGWSRYVGNHGDVLAVDHFGASAPGDIVMREYGFTVANVCRRALTLLKTPR